MQWKACQVHTIFNVKLTDFSMINFSTLRFSLKVFNSPPTTQTSYPPLFKESGQRVSCRSVVIFALLFLFSIPAQAQAQQTDPKERGKAVLDDLRSGVLIVRLPSDHRKTTALQEALDNDDLSETNKNYLQRELEGTKIERKKLNEELMQAFAENYTFSDVLFMYDTAMSLLNDGRQRGYFLDSMLQVDERLSLENRPYAVLRWGNTDQSTSTGAESLVLMDAQGENLTPPFPHAFKINRIGYLFNKFFSPSVAEERNFEKIVQKIEKQWTNFYLKMGGGL